MARSASKKKTSTPWSGFRSTVLATTTGNAPRQAVSSAVSISLCGKSAWSRSKKAHRPASPSATLATTSGQYLSGAIHKRDETSHAQAALGWPAQL